MADMAIEPFFNQFHGVFKRMVFRHGCAFGLAAVLLEQLQRVKDKKDRGQQQQPGKKLLGRERVFKPVGMVA